MSGYVSPQQTCHIYAYDTEHITVLYKSRSDSYRSDSHSLSICFKLSLSCITSRILPVTWSSRTKTVLVCNAQQPPLKMCIENHRAVSRDSTICVRMFVILSPFYDVRDLLSSTSVTVQNSTRKYFSNKKRFQNKLYRADSRLENIKVHYIWGDHYCMK